jgi:hypothetical protein
VTAARLWHPWLRINRVLRVMQTRWSGEAWLVVRVEFRRALALRSEIGARGGSTNEEARMAFGDIPEIRVGTLFDSRRALYDAGVHRQLQAGIAGGEQAGAESIVVSGGYEDDEDYGDVIVYTGQGGNDANTARQVADQQLTLGNAGLMKSRVEGLPVRVIRGAHPGSAFAPATGLRYDGLYYVEDAHHVIGKSGFKSGVSHCDGKTQRHRRGLQPTRRRRRPRPRRESRKSPFSA